MKPSLHGFKFRFDKKFSNGYRSATKGLGSLLKAGKGHNQGLKVVFLFLKVTSTSRHTHKGYHGRFFFFFSRSRSPQGSLDGEVGKRP